MLVLADTINKGTEKIEIFLNAAASVPFLGILGTAGRVSATKIQLVAGPVFMGLGVLAFAAAKIAEAEDDAEEARIFIQFGCEYTGHGVLNAVRCCAEIVSFCLTLGFGTLWYNMSGSSEEHFEPKYKYSEYSGNPHYIFA